MKILLTLLALVLAPQVFAGTLVYEGHGGEKLMIQDATSLGKDAFLVKFTGLESKWANKVIKTKRIAAADGSFRYQFDYELELSSGKQKKVYQIAVDDGFELINGSRVPKIQLFTQEMPNNKPYELDLNTAASKAGGNDLAAEYKKSPFSPEVE